jgi:BirA family biotin operon repressor/biotin-[acetyl-CoA-carboxylase] ligase
LAFLCAKNANNLEDFAFIDQVGKILLFYSPSCGSTQDLVTRCARQAGKKHPVALLTFHQTRGRGQQNHTWEAEPGKNLAMSVWLPLKNPRPDTFPLLNMALTSACTKGIGTMCAEVMIKWPNDLRHRGAKLAGILMETQSDADLGKYLCMGIGVNVNQSDFVHLPQPATSLKNTTGKEYNLMDLARALLTQIQTAFAAWEKQPDDNHFLAEFNELLEGKNQYWEAECGADEQIQGLLHGVDAQGRILFETAGKTTALHHGAVRLKICLSQK